ncbi:dihydrolipoyl dehydrogenase family protein [Plastorhodobacter daqingensis]|uniref:Dihydrolipoyl dehydrogenase family protein n=1 Tax=Plastorhodobacter daqingensis TaxID=1387281 RepID=A0ABW2UFV6_9RHOB
MKRIRTDICVIGAGSGGLTVAAGAAQLGASVVLVEGAEMGGDCLNHGCVPSKTLIAAARRAHVLAEAGAVPGQNMAEVADRIQAVIAAIAPMDSQERFEGLGVIVIRDWGRFVSKTELEAGGCVITARRFVVATGSSPVVPPIPGLAEVPFLTNETVFALRETPRHLLVIGGGPIGLELAQAHRRLGAEVTVIEAGKALGREDPEAAAVVLEKLRTEGVDVREGAAAQRVSREGDDILLHLEGETLRGSHLLVAVGRAPNLERLNLKAAGVAHERTGITTDSRLRSSNRRILAVGDVAGRGQFTHLANHHAGLVVRRAVLGLPVRLRDDHVPRVTYTNPELAQVGLTEAEARKAHGASVTVLRLPYADNDRARAEGQETGFLKLVVRRGRPIGVTIVGAQAGELIALWSFMISSRARLSALSGTVLPYPTLSELSKRAAGAYFSPKLFDNGLVRRIVGIVQRLLP